MLVFCVNDGCVKTSGCRAAKSKCSRPCVIFFSYRPINASDRSFLFEHYMHPCIANNASNIVVSRYLLPFGLQGFEFSVTILLYLLDACDLPL